MSQRRRGGRTITKWLAVGWLVFLVFTSVFANHLPYIYHSCDQFESATQCSTYDTGSLAKAKRAPVWATFSSYDPPGIGEPRAGLMGTDNNGYDIFSRSMVGARMSLIIAGLSITFGLLIGTLLGLLAGYRGGWTDRIIETGTNVLLAFPPLLLATAMVTFFSPVEVDAKRPIWPIIVALTLLSIPPLTRLVRANTIAYSQREFVLAARSLGAKPGRIVFREILPNIVPSLVSFALTGLALLIVAEGGLAVFGLSVELPSPTWGRMIFSGTPALRDGQWWQSLMPALVMFLTILSINLLGDIYSERFNVREAIG